MSAPLLSRFDLVFVLTDDPDEERDKRIRRQRDAIVAADGKSMKELGKTTHLTFAEKFQLERKKRREAEAAATAAAIMQQQQQQQQQQQRGSPSMSETILASAKKQKSQRVFMLNHAPNAPVGYTTNTPPPLSVRDVGLKEYLERKSEDIDDKGALFDDHKRTSYDDMRLHLLHA